MPRLQMKKVMLYLPPQTLAAYTALAESSGTSRSEIMRGVLDRGILSAAKQAQRTAKLSEAVGFAAPVQPVLRAAAPDPAVQLAAYARSLASTNPDIEADQFRSMVEAQSLVLAVPPDRRVSAVDEACAVLSPEPGPADEEILADEAPPEEPGELPE